MYFVLGSKKTAFLAGRRDAVHLSVGRRANVKRAFGVERDGLRGEIVDSNAVVGLPLASKRNTLAGEPPAA